MVDKNIGWRLLCTLMHKAVERARIKTTPYQDNHSRRKTSLVSMDIECSFFHTIQRHLWICYCSTFLKPSNWLFHEWNVSFDCFHFSVVKSKNPWRKKSGKSKNVAFFGFTLEDVYSIRCGLSGQFAECTFCHAVLSKADGWPPVTRLNFWTFWWAFF